MNTFTNKVSKITSKINTTENKEDLKAAFVTTMVFNGIISFIVPASANTRKTFIPSKTEVAALTVQLGLTFLAKKLERSALKDIEL